MRSSRIGRLIRAREWVMVNDHVHASDFPETDSNWHGLGESAGFSRVTSLYTSPTRLFALYLFQA